MIKNGSIINKRIYFDTDDVCYFVAQLVEQ